MSGAPDDDSHDDERAWQEVLHDVAPLPASSIIHPMMRKQRITVRPRPAPMPSLPMFDEPATLEKFDANTLKRIKSGRMPIEGTLDLHGLSAEQAYEAFHAFMMDAYAHNAALVLIITGKGRVSEHGVLRSNLPRWCEESAFRPMIIGLHKAAPNHGGQGAYYVRLRRKR